MSEKCILLVEDNPDDAELTLLAFRKNRISNEVIVAKDGVEAAEWLFGEKSGAHALPAIVLLDLKLPKLDGLELLRMIRGNPVTHLIPVIVLTTSREEQDLVASYSLGCNSYVRKPVSFEEFVEAAKHVGLYWLLLNEPPPLILPTP